MAEMTLSPDRAAWEAAKDELIRNPGLFAPRIGKNELKSRLKKIDIESVRAWAVGNKYLFTCGREWILRRPADRTIHNVLLHAAIKPGGGGNYWLEPYVATAPYKSPVGKLGTCLVRAIVWPVEWTRHKQFRPGLPEERIDTWIDFRLGEETFSIKVGGNQYDIPMGLQMFFKNHYAPADEMRKFSRCFDAVGDVEIADVIYTTAFGDAVAYRHKASREVITESKHAAEQCAFHLSPPVFYRTAAGGWEIRRAGHTTP